MAKNKNSDSATDDESFARLVTSPEDKAKSAKWFERARELGDKRQFDYAIEYYVSGLEYWPDAVEEACKPLHGCAVARRQMGGKKPGLKDSMKRSLSDKNVKQALLNSLWLFGRDPDNLAYIEGVLKNASRLRAEDTAKWAAGVYLKSLESTPKVASKQFQALAETLEALGDRAAQRKEVEFGVSAFEMGLEALSLWRRRFPNDNRAATALKNLSTRLTILRGQYQDGESYRDSVRDTGEQMDLHDEKRSIQSDERMEDLIAKAQAAYDTNPDEKGALRSLIDLLCRREHSEDEVRAIGILVNEYKRTQDYRWKRQADDIRMKQLGRQTRQLEKEGDAAKLKAQRIHQLRFELSVFKERVQRYPTDNRLKYEYGVRNFQASRFDEAIPLFQAARSDPKNRSGCALYLGRCFFRKGYYNQAIAALREALDEHEFSDDDLAKSMYYWLGRTQEAAGQAQEARETYGTILQIDYNYRDVRARIDELPAGA